MNLKYIPQTNEAVVGIIRNRHSEGYRVDIGSAHPASLGALAFEGATKRNKPNLEVSFLEELSVQIDLFNLIYFFLFGDAVRWEH